MNTAEVRTNSTSLSIPPVGDEFRSLREQVYAALLQAIVERRFKPGERLVLDDLAAHLRVSRTPVRDALSRLAAEGLVQPNGRRGFCVTDLSGEELAQLYDMRLMCEQYALEKGLAAIDEALIAQLETHAAECVRLCESVDPGARVMVMLHDRELHRLVVRQADNPMLFDLFERLSIHARTFRAGSFFMPSLDLRTAYQVEHSALIAAMSARDLAGAREAIRTHTTNGLQRALAMLHAQHEWPQAADPPGHQ
jgi:DNA-binding GntR family transcriptional regulator